MTTQPCVPRGAGVYFSACADRRARFLSSCGAAFASVTTTESPEATAALLATDHADIVILDLEGQRYLAGLSLVGSLVRNRAGRPLLVLCGAEQSGWLPELMVYGTFDYAISPLFDAGLQSAIDRALATAQGGAARTEQRLLDKEREMRDLLGVQRSVQRALGAIGDTDALAAKICLALCNFPGVCHTSLLLMKERGDLQLAAQEARNHLDLAWLLERRDRLLEAPLRQVFPALLAAAPQGQIVLLDAPEKAGDPVLAMRLHDRHVRMVLALPLRAETGGAELGALCLMFDRHIMFSREQWACLASLAQSVSLGLAMSGLKHRNDMLDERLSQLDHIDPLTGVTNRRSGEGLLEEEIRRARRYGLALTVLAFDVTSFRSLSDLHGQPLTDSAMRQCARTVARRLRASDTLARMPGQRFLLIAPHTGADAALYLADQLRAAIHGADLPACATASVSLAVVHPGPEDDAAAVIQRLDAGLLRARHTGRNCIELCA